MLVDSVFEVGSPKAGKGRAVSLPAVVAGLLAPSDPDALVFPRLDQWRPYARAGYCVGFDTKLLLKPQ